MPLDAYIAQICCVVDLDVILCDCPLFSRETLNKAAK